VEPIFTLQWPEYVVANELQNHLPKSKNYSILVPASRQEKGIDLAILRKSAEGSRVVTLQIKASRTYMLPPKRATTKRHKHLTWFNCFEVSEHADFYLLFGTYAPDTQQTKRVNHAWYKSLMLLFTAAEMKSFIDSCRTKKGGSDRMFAFGFDDEERIEQTRGDAMRRFQDFSDHILTKRIHYLEKKLN
jgi:hypothetical protein